MTEVRSRKRLAWLGLAFGLAAGLTGFTSTAASADQNGVSFKSQLPNHFCLDIATEDPADHALAQLWNCTGVDEQKFLFGTSPFFPPNEFTISAQGGRGTGRCLTAGANGAEVFQTPCNGSSAQLWQLVTVNGQLEIVSPSTAGCLIASRDALHASVNTVQCRATGQPPAELWKQA